MKLDRDALWEKYRSELGPMYRGGFERVLDDIERQRGEHEGCHKLDTKSQVFFYEQEFYVLSNFSAFTLQWRNLRFDTSEAAYHYEKFIGGGIRAGAVARNILNAPSAHEAFKIAERNNELRRPDWDMVRVGIMRDILRAKVEQHEYVRRKLLATGYRELIEDSWRDHFWGWGPNRDGQNMLGKLWMEIRAELRAADPSESSATGQVGTFACPICGKLSPHAHDELQIIAWLEGQAKRFLPNKRLLITAMIPGLLPGLHQSFVLLRARGFEDAANVVKATFDFLNYEVASGEKSKLIDDILAARPAEPQERETPRTDALIRSYFGQKNADQRNSMEEHARKLERELSQAREQIANWQYSAKYDDEHFNAMKERAERAEQQLAEYKKDAERLNYLDANPRIVLRTGKQHIRPIIDAAIAQRKD